MSIRKAARLRGRWRMVAFAACALLSTWLHAATGGPSAYGYTWIDLNSPGGPGSDGVRFANIATSGTPIALSPSMDDGTASLSLPFPFRFHGTAFTSVSACANGYLYFGAGGCDEAPHNGTFEPQSYIAAWWSDLDGRCAGAEMDQATFGSAPNRRFVVQWTNFGHYNNRCAAAEIATFQVVLHETSNVIEVLHSGVSGTNGAPHWIEIGNGGALLTAYSATSANGAGMGVMFLPPPANASSASWTCSSPRVAVPDSPSTGVSNIITFPAGDTRVIADLDAFVNLPHSFVGDLTVRLVQESSNTTVTLLNRQCASGHNVAALALSDEASSLPTCLSFPAMAMQGVGRPAQPLSAFDNRPVAGNWRLEVADGSSSDVGTLMQWCLGVTAVPTTTPQTIDFTLPFTTRQRLQTPVTFTAPTASSGLPVTVISQTPAVCTVSGTSISLLATGICSLQATQPGDATYDPATPVVRSFTVVRTPQSITLEPLPDRSRFDPPFTAMATASSGLPVTIESQTPESCTVAGDTVTLVGSGLCFLRAAQDGDADYEPATPQVWTFTVTPATQSIDFAALPDRSRFDAPFAVSATTTSSLDVAIDSTTPAVCTTASNTVTLVATGTCTLRATQAGDADYAAATPVERSFTVTAATQSINFAALPDVEWSAATVSLVASASSGLAVEFASTTPAICSVTGNVATLLGVGRCEFRATQDGDGKYEAAAPVLQDFDVLAPTVDIDPASLPAGVTGVAYAAELSATAYGDVPPYALVLVSGALPPGLTLADAIDGDAEIAGVPTTAGSFQFTVGVADATTAANGGPFTGMRTYVIVVAEPRVFRDGFE